MFTALQWCVINSEDRNYGRKCMNSREHHNLLYVIFTLLVCCTTQSFSQSRDVNANAENDQMEKSRTGMNVIQFAGIPLESTINPESYYVGPSDIIAVNIWTGPPLSFSLTVTPEGTLIVPTVGEISVTRQTLAKVKQNVMDATRKKYLNAGITVTLLKPRNVLVNVLGNVARPGMITLNAVNRVSGAIQMSNQNPDDRDEQRLRNLRHGEADNLSRNIVVRHADGTEERADLVKYLGTKDDRWNPYLREGDLIVVPMRNKDKNVFGIYGEANAPGRYEFVEGDNLSDAIKIGQGLTTRGEADSVHFFRLNANGTEMTARILAVREGMSDLPIQPGDRIVVPSVLDLREDYRVT